MDKMPDLGSFVDYVWRLKEEHAAQAARIAELESMVRKLVRQHLPVEELEGMPGWSEVQDALKLNARVAELERECERLRREFVEVEAERNAWRDGAKKIAVGRLDEIKEVQDLRDELEACRKDAGYWRCIRDRLGEPGDEVHVMFGEWCWADGSIEDVEAAIDAAMQEASSDASS